MFPEGRALEFLLAAVIALVVVGPKDLPILMRKLGQFLGRMRAMAAEFRASFDEMARQSELDDLRKEVEAMRKGQLADIATHAGAPEANQAFEEISRALHGFEHLNKTVGTMFSDLAERVYPDLEKAAEAGKPRDAGESASPTVHNLRILHNRPAAHTRRSQSANKSWLFRTARACGGQRRKPVHGPGCKPGG